MKKLLLLFYIIKVKQQNKLINYNVFGWSNGWSNGQSNGWSNS
jgi:hypothetical protein